MPLTGKEMGHPSPGLLLGVLPLLSWVPWIIADPQCSGQVGNRLLVYHELLLKFDAVSGNPA